MAKFMSLGSGSSGNCYYFEHNNKAILLDVGISYRRIKKLLKEKGIDITNIYAILITHDHADHIKSVGYFGEELNIPIFTTKDIHVGINKCYCTSKKIYSCVRHIDKYQKFFLDDLEIFAFDVPHDSTDCVGYMINFDNKSLLLATDIGEVTENLKSYISSSDYIVIESNYDEDMLKRGRYPQSLKDRISGNRGHISNQDTANLLYDYLTKRTKHIWLCHLSKDNNTSELALKTIEEKIKERGFISGENIDITALERKLPSPLYDI